MEIFTLQYFSSFQVALLFYNHSEVDDLKLFYKKEHYLSSRHFTLHGD